MRTLLLLGCLVVALLVVPGSGFSGRSALNHRVLEKLQNLHGTMEKKATPSMRRLGRVLTNLKAKKRGLSSEASEMTSSEEEAYEEGKEFLDEVVMFLMSSENFCAAPLAQEDVQAIKNTIDQLGNAVIEKITEVLSQIDAGTLDITKEKLQEFEDALDRVGEGGDHVLVEVSAVFYRYILYGTTEDSNCEIGDSMPNFEEEGGETQIENVYQRMGCLGINMFFFAWFVQDPYNSMWGEDAFTDDSDAEWEAARCKALTDYLEPFEDDIGSADFGEVKTKVKEDLQCVKDKIQELVDYTPQSTDQLADRMEGLYTAFMSIFSDMSDMGWALWWMKTGGDVSSRENLIERLVKAIRNL